MSSILSRNLRALSLEDAEAFFVKVYCGIGEALRRLSVRVKVLLDIISGMKTSNNVFTPVQSLGSKGDPAVRSPSLSMGYNLQEEITQALNISTLLVQVVDKAQSEITKVLRVRTEQTAVSGHFGEAVKGIVNNQIHDFIPLLHEAEKQKLVQKIESEKWERIDFKPQPQDALILAHIAQSMTTDPPAWLDYTDVSTADLEAGQLNVQKTRTPTEPTSAAKQNKKDPTLAVIEGMKFTLVDSAAYALRGIEQYAILLASVPGWSTTSPRSYLTISNSGLTNINTKHLALASQSLSFFIALTPYVRESVRR
ncbi:unnamed protein product [Penicillium nalgiovense]|nr:unnamed protein product [Penicillium nalgiovense]